MNASGSLRTYAADGPKRRFPEKSRRAGPRLRADAVYVLLSSREEGNALVEFALMAPIMLMIMMGIVVIGSTMSNYLQLVESTASAARIIAVSRSNTLDPCNTAVSAASSGAPMLNSANMTYTLVLNSPLGATLGTYGPTKGSLSCSSSSNTSGPPSYLQARGSATFTVTYPCNLTIYGKNYWSGCTLQAQTTEMIQ
jgi:Flp pilus assembly protein TadG